MNLFAPVSYAKRAWAEVREVLNEIEAANYQYPLPLPLSIPEVDSRQEEKIDVTREREVDAEDKINGYSVKELYRLAHDAEGRAVCDDRGSINIDGVSYLHFQAAHDAVASVCADGPRAIIDLLNRLGFSDVDPGPTNEDGDLTQGA